MVCATIFFSCVTTIFPKFIWLTKWKNSGHTHFSCVTTFSASRFWKNSGHATEKMWSHRPYI